jgi:hypothetical protein
MLVATAVVVAGLDGMGTQTSAQTPEQFYTGKTMGHPEWRWPA